MTYHTPTQKDTMVEKISDIRTTSENIVIAVWISGLLPYVLLLLNLHAGIIAESALAVVAIVLGLRVRREHIRYMLGIYMIWAGITLFAVVCFIIWLAGGFNA